MNRPLCPIFLGALAVVSLWLSLFPNFFDVKISMEQSAATFAGRITRRERRRAYDDAPVYDYYLQADGYDRLIQIVMEREALDEMGDAAPKIGQRAIVVGEWTPFAEATNPGEFDQRNYYLTQNVVGRLRKARFVRIEGRAALAGEYLARVRERLGDSLDQSLNETDAGVMRAILLGDKSALDGEIKTLYQQNGIVHILAVSGLHVTFLGMGLYRALLKCRIPRGASCAVSVTAMIAYGVMCGMSASALRAVSMFALRLIAPIVGRTYDMLSAMSLTGIMLLIEQPLYARHSGFLLSFLSICALGIFGRAQTSARDRALTGLAVALTTLPVYMCFYYTFPVYSVALNLLVMPLTGVLLPAGALTTALGCLFPPLGVMCGYVVRAILFFYETICLAGRALPFATWRAGHSLPWQVAVYYLLLIAFAYLRKRCKRKGTTRVVMSRKAQERAIKIRAHYALPVVAVVILSLRFSPALKITAVDVGQGDGIVIRHGAYTALIDGGSTSKSGVGTYQIMPYLKYEGVRFLDAVMVSHEDADHISGVLELIDETGEGGIQIGRLLLPQIDEAAKSDAYRQLEDAASSRNIEISYLRRGMSFSLGDVTYTCLGPVADGVAYRGENANAHSMILHLRYGAFSALFTGDVEEEGLTELNGTLSALPPEMRDVSVLKVAHHGSRMTTDETFLSLVDARVSLISCGRDNRYGHPHAELIERLEADGTTIFSTAECGAITIHVSKGGQKMTVKTFLPTQTGVN